MDVAQLRAVDAAAFGFKIGHLAGDQFLAARGGGDFTEDFAKIITLRALDLGGNLERNGQQRVTGQDGNAVAKNLVAGRAAAAEVVVVHAGEIVMDERIGVDAFDGAGEREARRSILPPQASAAARQRIGRRRFPPANKL